MKIYVYTHRVPDKVIGFQTERHRYKYIFYDIEREPDRESYRFTYQ